MNKMALITCPECSKEISDSASACPHCGYPLKEANPFKYKNKETKSNKSIRPMLWGILFIFAGAYFILFVNMVLGLVLMLIGVILGAVSDRLN